MRKDVRSKHRKSLHTFIGMAGIAAILSAWILLTVLEVVPDAILPSPVAVLRWFVVRRDRLLTDVLSTLARVGIGFAVGTFLGLVAALAISASRPLDALLDRVVPMLRAIPPIAILPFVTLWFGLKLSGMMFLVGWGCFFIVVIDALEAIKNIARIYLWAAYSLGLRKRDVYRRVIVPAVIPGILGGVRVAAVTGFNLVLLAEFNIATKGIGLIIITGYRFLRPDLLIFGLLIAIVTAFLIDRLIASLGGLLTRWR